MRVCGLGVLERRSHGSTRKMAIFALSRLDSKAKCASTGPALRAPPPRRLPAALQDTGSYCTVGACRLKTRSSPNARGSLGAATGVRLDASERDRLTDMALKDSSPQRSRILGTGVPIRRMCRRLQRQSQRTSQGNMKGTQARPPAPTRPLLIRSSMVRSGSTVRVRQRASGTPCKTRTSGDFCCLFRHARER